MDDVKKTYREGEESAKEAWRNRDGEDLGDAVGNAGDDLRKGLGNVGDDLRRTDVDEPTTDRPMTSDTDLTDEDADRPV